ncbi:porin family protein [Mongoliibacter ruber]|uniref:Outer membrane protein with beta-barrel domain n=1 Tax=Mongoliibacter ruber TaxID=1750599 RepID=A0A2T0WQC7_9BACT|nr:porin family protein [Mongoliibacter ruber]PRY88899.1 outer membrane protein with beta-barrel domain [Mongoliibacter ruber]
MKQAVLVFITILLSHAISAQEFSIGPKVGVSQANISVNGDAFSSGDSFTGYHLGLFVRMGGSSIFVQPEFLFTNTGGTIVETSNTSVRTINANFNRFDIPLMMGFKLANFFRVQAGPIASVLLDYTIEDGVQNALDVDYSNSTIGYQAGVGLDVGNLILDFKYENSLGKISRSVAGFETDQRQNQLIISAGFRLF